MARQALRKRLVKLAHECGFERFSNTENGVIELAQLMNKVPDEELNQVEAALKNFEGLQEALRSSN